VVELSHDPTVAIPTEGQGMPARAVSWPVPVSMTAARTA
jgi:hypothetical protein